VDAGLALWHRDRLHEVEAGVSGREETLWTEGPMDPVPMMDD
jgi:hypothetical protein